MRQSHGVSTGGRTNIDPEWRGSRLLAIAQRKDVDKFGVSFQEKEWGVFLNDPNPALVTAAGRLSACPR